MPTPQKLEIKIQAGTHASPDNTDLASLHYTATDKVYFYNGNLTKLGGWNAVAPADGSVNLLGAIRSVFSYRTDKERTVLGAHNRLYVYQDGLVYNITPVSTSATAIANSLDSHYTTLGSNPLATVSGSDTVTVTHTAHGLAANDRVTLSGAATTNGIPAGDFNTVQVVRSIVDANSYTIMTATAATSTGSGGGASVVEATRYITVNATAHGLSADDRVKILAAATFAGIPDTEINLEHIITNVTTNAFDIVVTTSYATSSVTSGGGASTEFYPPLVDGAIDPSSGLGYGGGLYGVGLYGVAKTFVNTLISPSIWSFGRFGNDLICSAGRNSVGTGSNVFIWDGDTTAAPTILSNAPTTADWVFVSDNSVATLTGSTINVSDAGDATDWTPAPDSNAYTDTIEGIGDIISQAKSNNTNLLFTEDDVLTLTRVGRPNIWEAGDLLKDDGIIGAKARVEIDNNVIWVGKKNFYVFDGASVQVAPNNTVWKYFYDNLNVAQQSKVFILPDSKFKQVWVFFPTGASDECNEYAIINYEQWHYTLGTMARTAGEEPVNITSTPYWVDASDAAVTGYIYKHQDGVDANGSAMQAYAVTNYGVIDSGNYMLEVLGVYPDTIQTGDMTVTCSVKEYAQSVGTDTEAFTCEPTTEFMDFRLMGRQRKYRFESNVVGGNFQLGRWYEAVQRAPEAP